MGQIHPPKPVLLLLAAFSRHESVLDGAREFASATWGPIALESPRFEFLDTSYYDATMGPQLMKTFFLFQRPIQPEQLVQIKLDTNQAELEVSQRASFSEPRPLNLDPGYLSESKLVLASTKDHAHRIYLGKGVYAEITLRYRKHQWRPWEWTYPDYRRSDYLAFFEECRAYLRTRRLS